MLFIPKHVTDLLLPDHPAVVRSVHYLASGERIPSSSPLIFLRHHDPTHSVSVNLDTYTQHEMHTLNS